MRNQIINHSPDLKRLRDEGFDIRIEHGHLFVHSIPYLNEKKQILYGTLITVLNNSQKVIEGVTLEVAGNPATHVAYFKGELPCYSDGRFIEPLRRESRTKIANGTDVNWEFSIKPNGQIPSDYYQLVTNYVQMMEIHAQEIDPNVRARNFNPVETEEEESIFKYFDTNSSRAEIIPISNKLKSQKIGIIGLGGTGSYILDLVAKTEVAEIHLFDGDIFLQHNAFRAPGAPSKEELSLKNKKTTYFQTIYSKMRTGIIDHPNYFTNDSLVLLNELDFVFMCFDKGSIKKVIIERLEQIDKPFIDVGISIESIDNEYLIGSLKVVSSKPGCREFLRRNNRVNFADDNDDDLYNENIQIAELNALNACLAVIKWKKYLGFYQDKNNENFTLYSTNDHNFLDNDHCT
ncbi:MAG: ThiF family adenylyltransferase [Flavobacteriaceae bacterium]|nr:ThiF family adenylyltransferase [Flavobacteriaceae bacterium]